MSFKLLAHITFCIMPARMKTLLSLIHSQFCVAVVWTMNSHKSKCDIIYLSKNVSIIECKLQKNLCCMTVRVTAQR